MSSRQRSVLQLVASGARNAEIAFELGIGLRRVSQILLRLRALGLVADFPGRGRVAFVPDDLEVWEDELLSAEYGAGGLRRGERTGL